MGDPRGDRTSGIDLLPLFVGDETYAVALDRVATVLRIGALDRAEPGDVVELSGHEVEIAAAADLLGERSAEVTAVVFRCCGEDRYVPGWLVADVGDPTTVDEVKPTVGSVRHVRGKVAVDGEAVVLIDPVRIHGA